MTGTGVNIFIYQSSATNLIFRLNNSHHNGEEKEQEEEQTPGQQE